MNSKILAFFIFLSFFACNKVILPNSDCTNKYSAPAIDTFPPFRDSCSFLPDYNYVTKYGYSYPQFNPNNGNQIAYLRHRTFPSYSYRQELWTFDFCTGEQMLLTDNISSHYDWGINGWILYMNSNRQLCKIKCDGDSLTQLTFSGSYNTQPSWSPDGKAYYFVKEVSSDRNSYLASQDGTIFMNLGKDIMGKANVHWALDSVLLVQDRQQISVFNLETLELQPFVTLENLFGDLTGPVHYLKKSNAVLWSTLFKMGITHLDTHYERRFFESPWDGSKNVVVDVSPNEQLIIISRVNVLKTGRCVRQIEEVLYLIDIDGKNERRLILPE